MAVHASKVFPDESQFYNQRRPNNDNEQPPTYNIQYSADFNNVDGSNKDQEEVLIVNLDSMENVNGENIEDYIESIYNEDDWGAEQRSSFVTYNENFNISEDVNHFGQEWNLMENDRIDLAADTWQDYTDQSLGASNSHQVQMFDGEHFGQQWDIMEDYIDKQVSPNYVADVIEDYIDKQVSPNYVNEDYIDHQVSPKYVEVEESHIISPSNFGQEWDIMEDFVPPMVSYDYTPHEVQEVELSAGLHVSSEDYEVGSINNLVQGRNSVDEEQKVEKHQDNTKAASVEVNPIIEGQQFEEYESHNNHNPELAFNSQIVTVQEENPYYNSGPMVMVHEHITDDDSSFIPNINSEAKNENLYIGLLNEDNKFHPNDDLGVENDNLTEVDTNHINISHQAEEKDYMSRHAKVDIVSERETTARVTDIPETVTETPTTETTTQTETPLPSTHTTATTTQTDAPLSTTEIVSQPTTFLPYTESDTETIQTTVAPTEVIPALQSDPLGLPYNIDALSLVSMSSLNTEREDSLTTPLLPFPEPLTAEQEIYSFPAGHGLRFKFRIDQLNNYIPNFGFRTDE